MLTRRGWGITAIHILNIKKWYGRYFFIQFRKDEPSIITWQATAVWIKQPGGTKKIDGAFGGDKLDGNTIKEFPAKHSINVASNKSKEHAGYKS